MNESDMPREWWGAQDQDEAWIKQQEEEMQQREAEAQRVPVQLELPFDAPTEQELEEEYDINRFAFVLIKPDATLLHIKDCVAFMARLEEEAKRHES